jgi:hypothetical protein
MASSLALRAGSLARRDEAAGREAAGQGHAAAARSQILRSAQDDRAGRLLNRPEPIPAQGRDSATPMLLRRAGWRGIAGSCKPDRQTRAEAQPAICAVDAGRLGEFGGDALQRPQDHHGKEWIGEPDVNDNDGSEGSDGIGGIAAFRSCSGRGEPASYQNGTPPAPLLFVFIGEYT